ncbi:condensation domain-containing protein [Micromonospora sp. BRA006-A]|nr:condensation domain-containing protein [Micromonospora sp. BRA006-A]
MAWRADRPAPRRRRPRLVAGPPDRGACGAAASRRRDRPAEQTYTSATVRTRLDRAATAALTDLAAGLGATPAAAVLAAFALVLARRTGLPDLVVGTPTVDRRAADFEAMVGFFIEIAPLRLRRTPGAGFAAHVRAAWEELLAALAHRRHLSNASSAASGWAVCSTAARWCRCCSTCTRSTSPGSTWPACPPSRCRCPRPAHRSTSRSTASPGTGGCAWRSSSTRTSTARP